MILKLKFLIYRTHSDRYNGIMKLVRDMLYEKLIIIHCYPWAVWWSKTTPARSFAAFGPTF
jgi:hypothetical protein